MGSRPTGPAPTRSRREKRQPLGGGRLKDMEAIKNPVLLANIDAPMLRASPAWGCPDFAPCDGPRSRLHLHPHTRSKVRLKIQAFAQRKPLVQTIAAAGSNDSNANTGSEANCSCWFKGFKCKHWPRGKVAVAGPKWRSARGTPRQSDRSERPNTHPRDGEQGEGHLETHKHQAKATPRRRARPHN